MVSEIKSMSCLPFDKGTGTKGTRPIQFSSVRRSRQAVGVDFYFMMESECGMKAVMTLCDLFSAWTLYCPVRDTMAVTAMNCLLENWIFIRGCPSVLVSDADPALMSAIAQGLMKALRIRHVATHVWPRRNAKTERKH